MASSPQASPPTPRAHLYVNAKCIASCAALQPLFCWTQMWICADPRNGQTVVRVQKQRAGDRTAQRVCGSSPAAVNKWPPARPPILRWECFICYDADTGWRRLWVRSVRRQKDAANITDKLLNSTQTFTSGSLYRCINLYPANVENMASS
jgi:hypothetical protein